MTMLPYKDDLFIFDHIFEGAQGGRAGVPLTDGRAADGLV
jgi:hypothetical protein